MDRRADKTREKALAESYRAQEEAEAQRADLHTVSTWQLVRALRDAAALAVAASDTAPGPGGSAALPFRPAIERALELAEHESERAEFLVATNRTQAQADVRGAVCRSYLAARGAMVADSIAEEAADAFVAIAAQVQVAAVEAVDAADLVRDSALTAAGARSATAAAESAERAADWAPAILRDTLRGVRAMLDALGPRALQHAVDGAADRLSKAMFDNGVATAAMDERDADGYTTQRAVAAQAAVTVAENLAADLAALAEEDTKEDAENVIAGGAE